MEISIGITRIVFCFSRFVIKVPNLLNGYIHFMHGCYANVLERHYTKKFVLFGHTDYISPTKFCFLFGLFSVQKRVIILTEDEFIEIPKTVEENLRKISSGYQHHNLGWLNGKIVFVDYA